MFHVPRSSACPTKQAKRVVGLHVVVLLLSLCAGLLLLVNLHTSGQFISKTSLQFALWGLPLLFVIYGVSRKRPAFTWIFKPSTVQVGVLLLALCVLSLFTSFNRHEWFFFMGWENRLGTKPGFAQLGVFQFVLFTVILTPFFMGRIRHKTRWLLLLLVVAECLFAYQFLRETKGQVLYRDDHVSFVFRLWEFSETFPQLVNFNPYWNGGVEEHHGASSGVTSLGLLFWPLLKLMTPDRFYTFAILFIFVGLAPWLTVLALRMMNLNRATAYLGGILALGVSRQFFLWLLHYGTVAASFSMLFLLPALAALYRVLYLDKREWWTGVVLVISVFFLMLWPLAGIILLFMVIGALFSLRRLTLRKTLFLTICGLLFVALYAKNLVIIFTSSRTFEEHVVGVVQSEGAGQHFAMNLDILKAGWAHLFKRIGSTNPLLLFLGLAGVFFYPSRRIRLWFAPVVIGLILVTGWGRLYFPDLQLRRMAIPLSFILVAPAALWSMRILSTRGPWLAVLRAALVAMLLTGVVSVSKIYRNQGPARYEVISQEMKELIAWIHDNTPEDGRVLFAGMTVHKYGRAHVAALPMFTGREMMACDYYHFSPKEVEYDYPPRVFRTMEDGYFKFAELYNVTHFITYHKNYIAYFDKHPNRFEKVHVIEKKNIHVYKVNRASDPFLTGGGVLDTHFNRIHVELNNAVGDSVIKYNWNDKLSADEGVELFPFEAGEGVTLIGIRPHGKRAFDIRFRSKI